MTDQQTADRLALRLFLILSFFNTEINASIFDEVIDDLEMRRLVETYTELQVDRVLEGAGGDLNASDRRAAAVLLTLGVLRIKDLDHPTRLQEKINAYLKVLGMKHPALRGHVGDAGLPLALDRDWRHDALENDRLAEVLASKLSAGVITGYDVRKKGVYDGFELEANIIYSHSSQLHLKQLVSLLAAEELSAWVYAAPKSAAFLYRDEWDVRPEDIRTLSTGVRIVETKELVVLFQFSSPDDRIRFHHLILKHAKRDFKDEARLITDAWWQPFYYTDRPLDGFEAISLVVLDAGNLEVTLTVPEPRTSAVVSSFGGAGFKIKIKRVWVNPAFRRFLDGDHR